MSGILISVIFHASSITNDVLEGLPYLLSLNPFASDRTILFFEIDSFFSKHLTSTNETLGGVVVGKLVSVSEIY